MDRQEAHELLQPVVAEFLAKAYGQLREISRDEVREVVGRTGKKYQIDIGSTLDDPKHSRNLRVFLSIDDGGWRAFHPFY